MTVFLNQYKTQRLLQKLSWFFAALLICFGLQSRAHAQELQPIPPLTALVVDQTGTLSTGEIAQLDTKLKAFEKTKGSQIGVLVVNTTAPEDIFSFSQRAAETYKLGRQGTGDGVLIVVSKNDRKMWIYVMRALEGAIPDLAAKRIINEQMKPAFAAGKFGVGIDAATTQLMKLIDGEQLPAPTENWQHANEEADLFTSILMLTLAVSFIGSGIAKATSRWLVAPIASAASGFIAFDMGAGLLAALVAFIVLMAIFVFGKRYAQLATQHRTTPFNRGAGRRNNDVFWGGGFGGGFGGGGFGGGGGWGGSGGGGDAAGGGAGGDW